MDLLLKEQDLLRGTSPAVSSHMESCFSCQCFLLSPALYLNSGHFQGLVFSPVQVTFFPSYLPIPSISLESHEVESVLGMPMLKVMSPLSLFRPG